MVVEEKGRKGDEFWQGQAALEQGPEEEWPGGAGLRGEASIRRLGRITRTRRARTSEPISQVSP